MNDDFIATTLAPKIFRFDDVDQFRSSVRNLNVDFTPLVRKICAEQTILSLPGCDLNFTKSFPRIYDVQLFPNCTAVGFSMDDGYPIQFNGVERDRSVIVIGSGGAAYNVVEKTPRQFASIIFTSEIEDRGWPQTGLNFKMFETSMSAQHALRSVVMHALAVASQPVEPFEVSATATAIKESLLAAIDVGFADVVTTTWAARANSTRKSKVFMDVQAALAGRVGSPIYSEELARQIGVPVRTMHDAVQRYRGMSLHRYLRLWRLWHVRQVLLAGTDSVKASALAFGFWHMGEFSKSYRLQFGETPSETLAKSR